jgi:hypothetical protein
MSAVSCPNLEAPTTYTHAVPQTVTIAMHLVCNQSYENYIASNRFFPISQPQPQVACGLYLFQELWNLCNASQIPSGFEMVHSDFSRLFEDGKIQGEYTLAHYLRLRQY